MHFYGDAEVEGVATDWTVEFASVRGGIIQDRYSLRPELISRRTGDRWEGHVRLDGVHEDYDGVYMIASPIVDFGGGGAGWAWAAELRSGESAGGFSEARAGRGCTESCETYNLREAGLLLLILGPLGALRRRAPWRPVAD